MKYQGIEIDWPLDRNVIRRGTENNSFGMVRRNKDGTPRPHQGWDFHALIGTPTYAICGGKVVSVSDSGDYGLTVTLAIGDTGHYAVYAHLQRTLVRVGDSLVRGALIGTTGDSGNARGMAAVDQHLHFEIRTTMNVGRGLAGRISPLQVFGVCPLREAVVRGMR
jgi:murein DD-endopeptidase MepM/ murein hydrolase activator NlpD